MNCYASNTGTLRNLSALRAASWRILLTPSNPTPRAGFRHAVDNGAFRSYLRQIPFDGDGFMRLVERHGASADFVVIPDKVAHRDSLEFSSSWISHLRGLKKLLLPVQD